MNTTFDYLGSVVVGGMIVAIVLTLNSNIVSSSFQRNLDLVSQEAAVNLVDILETDLKRAGYFHDGLSVILAKRTSIGVYGDFDGDGYPDLVTYRLGDSTELAQTRNPRDRPLYRTIGDDSLNVASGLVSLSFSFLDSMAVALPYDSLDSTGYLWRIRMIRFSIRVEPSEPVDTTFIPVEINRLVSPKNIAGW